MYEYCLFYRLADRKHKDIQFYNKGTLAKDDFFDHPIKDAKLGFQNKFFLSLVENSPHLASYI